MHVIQACNTDITKTKIKAAKSTAFNVVLLKWLFMKNYANNRHAAQGCRSNVRTGKGKTFFLCLRPPKVPKAYCSVAGRPLVGRTIHVFQKLGGGIATPTPPGFAPHGYGNDNHGYGNDNKGMQQFHNQDD